MLCWQWYPQLATWSNSFTLTDHWLATVVYRSCGADFLQNCFYTMDYHRLWQQQQLYIEVVELTSYKIAFIPWITTDCGNFRCKGIFCLQMDTGLFWWYMNQVMVRLCGQIVINIVTQYEYSYAKNLAIIKNLAIPNNKIIMLSCIASGALQQPWLSQCQLHVRVDLQCYDCCFCYYWCLHGIAMGRTCIIFAIFMYLAQY